MTNKKPIPTRKSTRYYEGKRDIFNLKNLNTSARI